MPRKVPEPMRLGDESWGSRVRRAYQTSKQEYHQTWKELAESVSRVQSISDNGLMQLTKLQEKPQRTKQLQTAFLLCRALNIDPADLDLNKADLKADFLASKEVADLLRPASPCFSISAA